MLLPKRSEPKAVFFILSMLFCVHLFAASVSDSVAKGFYYSVWIPINYIFFFRSAYIITAGLKDRVWLAFLWGGRIQILTAITLVVLGVHERAQFIYFEPSYMAIGLVPYLFASLFWSSNKLLDVSLVVALIVFNQSANMMIAIIVAFIFLLLTSQRLWLSIGLVLLTILCGYVFYQIALNDVGNPNHGIAVWLNENSISLDMMTAIFARAGNRIPRMLAALEQLNGHWLMGFGPGGYVEYTANRNFDHLTEGLDYLDPSGLPVINVLLEACANAGILAAILLICIFLYVLYMALIKIRNRSERRVIVGAMFALGVMLQFESSYLRAYVWLAFGVFVARSLHQNSESYLPVKVVK
jgi:hypothetical protein